MKNRMMVAAVALLASATAVSACGSKDEAKDWSGRPLEVTIDAEVNGVAFTIQAPQGMKEKDSLAGGSSRRWDAGSGDDLGQPWFVVSFEGDPPRNVDGFVRNAMLNPGTEIAKTETTDDGFVLVYHSPEKSMAAARVLKRKGGKHLTCYAMQTAGGKPLPSFDATIVWLEKLCRTLAIK